MLISKAARKVWRFDKYVEWIEGAIEVAKELEGNNPMTIRRLNRLLKEAMEEHDDVLLANGINGLSVI